MYEAVALVHAIRRVRDGQHARKKNRGWCARWHGRGLSVGRLLLRQGVATACRLAVVVVVVVVSLVIVMGAVGRVVVGVAERLRGVEMSLGGTVTARAVARVGEDGLAVTLAVAAVHVHAKGKGELDGGGHLAASVEEEALADGKKLTGDEGDRRGVEDGG